MTLPSPHSRARSRSIPRIVKGNEHAIFAALLRANGLPTPMTELRFASPRRWRFDYAFQHAAFGNRQVAVEVEGGAFTRGRHTRGKGFIADMEKYNEAALRGWIVLRVTPQQLCTLETVALIKRALLFTP